MFKSLLYNPIWPWLFEGAGTGEGAGVCPRPITLTETINEMNFGGVVKNLKLII